MIRFSNHYSSLKLVCLGNIWVFGRSMLITSFLSRQLFDNEESITFEENKATTVGIDDPFGYILAKLMVLHNPWKKRHYFCGEWNWHHSIAAPVRGLRPFSYQWRWSKTPTLGFCWWLWSCTELVSWPWLRMVCGSLAKRLRCSGCSRWCS